MSHALTLEEEQVAFEKQLDELLFVHAGKQVLFKNGQPVEFFDDPAKAYEAALRKFGTNEVFLIAPVKRAHPQVVSVAWTAGVMFGKRQEASTESESGSKETGKDKT
jgi:hypothetical protein